MNQKSSSKQSIIIGVITGALLLVITAPTTAGEAKTTQYCNSRFGFCINYPSNLIANPPPENGDGLVFHDSNGFILTASGINNVMDDTIESEMKSQGDGLDKVTYQAKGKNWYVLSGHKGSDILYLKTYVGNRAINHLHIQYPAKANSEYAKIVARISKSFKPGSLNDAN